MIQPTNVQQPYPQQGANAVSINIYNPQAYGSGAQQPAQQNTQQAPYGYTNSVYQMPQASVYAPQTMPQDGLYQQYPIMPQQLVAPAPQAMPESVMTEPQTVAQQQTEQQPTAQVQTQPETQQAPSVETAEAQPPVETVNADELVQGLKSTNVDQKADAINKIAAYAQEAPDVALQVVSEPIMQSLVDVIKEDTSALEGPTDKQIAVAEKIAKGEKLTPEEDALSEQLSPRDKANKNRIFALYTLAMIQKLQRDELNQYIENQKANGQQTIEPLKINDLIGYNDIVNVVKNDARPEVKVAAIQALQHVAEPQDKAEVETVLAEALNSQDEAVKNAATEAVNAFGTAQQPVEAAQTTETKPAEAQTAENQPAEAKKA